MKRITTAAAVPIPTIAKIGATARISMCTKRISSSSASRFFQEAMSSNLFRSPEDLNFRILKNIAVQLNNAINKSDDFEK